MPYDLYRSQSSFDSIQFEVFQTEVVKTKRRFVENSIPLDLFSIKLVIIVCFQLIKVLVFEFSSKEKKRITKTFII